jgi:hypothetical protein
MFGKAAHGKPQEDTASQSGLQIPSALGSISRKGDHFFEALCTAGEHDHTVKAKGATATIWNATSHRIDQRAFEPKGEFPISDPLLVGDGSSMSQFVRVA